MTSDSNPQFKGVPKILARKSAVEDQPSPESKPSSSESKFKADSSLSKLDDTKILKPFRKVPKEKLNDSKKKNAQPTTTGPNKQTVGPESNNPNPNTSNNSNQKKSKQKNSKSNEKAKKSSTDPVNTTQSLPPKIVFRTKNNNSVPAESSIKNNNI